MRIAILLAGLLPTIVSSVETGTPADSLSLADLEERLAGIDSELRQLARFSLDTLRKKLPEGGLEQLLTGREMEVLTLLAEGCVKKMIADRLEISISTVVTHVAHIHEKLQVQNAPSAIAKAFHMGILPINKTNNQAGRIPRT